MKISDLKYQTKYNDLLGIWASLLCTIHCYLTPFLFVIYPLRDAPSDHGHVHWMMFDYVFLGISFFAVYVSAKHTTHSIIRILLWVSWILFGAGILLESMFHIGIGSWMKYLGSFSLIICHFYNRRHCRIEAAGQVDLIERTK